MMSNAREYCKKQYFCLKLLTSFYSKVGTEEANLLFLVKKIWTYLIVLLSENENCCLCYLQLIYCDLEKFCQKTDK